MRIPFTKMHGLGNDFVVINAVIQHIPLTKKLICQIADRHFGVGCDQLLVLAQPTTKQEDIDFIYRVFNADGSEAEQCGNGVRCLAKFVHTNQLSKKRNLVFATKSSKIKAELENNGQVTVTISKPIFEPQSIPFVAKKRALRYNLSFSGYGKVEMGVVSVGNPHAVILLRSNFNCIESLGALISNSKYFPQRVNVGFMRIINRKQIALRVYERGSGETLACGSGACAAVVIGRLWGLLDPMVKVKLLGGSLIVKWDETSSSIQMIGPAEQVFAGEIILAR